MQFKRFYIDVRDTTYACWRVKYYDEKFFFYSSGSFPLNDVDKRSRHGDAAEEARDRETLKQKRNWEKLWHDTEDNLRRALVQEEEQRKRKREVKEKEEEEEEEEEPVLKQKKQEEEVKQKKEKPKDTYPSAAKADDPIKRKANKWFVKLLDVYKIDPLQEGPLVYLDADLLRTTESVRAAGYKNPASLIVPNINKGKYVEAMQRDAEGKATVLACSFRELLEALVYPRGNSELRAAVNADHISPIVGIWLDYCEQLNTQREDIEKLFSSGLLASRSIFGLTVTTSRVTGSSVAKERRAAVKLVQDCAEKANYYADFLRASDPSDSHTKPQTWFWLVESKK